MRTTKNTVRKVTAFRLLALTSTALVGFGLTSAAVAQEWTGATSADWFNGANWTPAQVPTVADDVTIDDTPGHSPRLTGVGSNAVAHDIVVGSAGVSSAILQIYNGATLTTNQTVLGDSAGSSGSIDIGGNGAQTVSYWTNAGSLIIGNSGFGVLGVGKGTVTTGSGLIGANAGSEGRALFSGTEAKWINNGALTVGGVGEGKLTITAGGAVSNAGIGIVGDAVGSTGTVIVDGAGSTWTNTHDLVLGVRGDGALNIANGGVVAADGVILGNFDAGSGALTVDGVGSMFTDGGELWVGFNGDGALTISDGGVVTSDSGVLGYSQDSVGEATVDGAGSTWTNTGGLTVGTSGDGTLNITNGGAVSNAGIGIVGDAVGSSGTVTVNGVGSTWTNAHDLVLGVRGGGALNIENGGMVAADGVILGNFDAGSGALTVDGVGSMFTDGGELWVGFNGDGALTISHGGVVTSDSGVLGYSQDSVGQATVDGAGSTWTSTGDLSIGLSGNATMDITGGGAVSDTTGIIAGNANSTSAVTVDGAGSTWTNSNEFVVGVLGDGTLKISNGGTVSDVFGSVGYGAGSQGSALVDGAGSNWSNSQVLGIGWIGTGSLTISNGGTVSALSGILGANTTGDGTATIDGAGSTWSNSGALIVGRSGAGVLNVTDGGAVSNAAGTLGRDVGATGTATVDGAGSTWANSGDLTVGLDGDGTLNVANGGSVSSSAGMIGAGAGSNGTATVDGAGSIWTNSNALYVGDSGSAALNITNGGVVHDLAGYVAATGSVATGHVTVDGAGSTWLNDLGTVIGMSGEGRLDIRNGGLVTGVIGALGSAAGSSGLAVVNGAGSTWDVSGDLMVGYAGDGALTIANGGTVSAGGALVLAQLAGSTGDLNIGGATTAGTLDATVLQFGAGAGRINFNHTNTNYAFDTAITGLGTLNQLAGVTRLTADSSIFGGPTFVTGGTLLVDGKLGVGAVDVQTGGTLGGMGRIGGEVTIRSGGTLRGVQGQTLSIQNLNLAGGAKVNVTLSAPGGAALFDVTNDLTLDGVLNITSGGAFGPGVYSLMTYGGVLTDNGLDIGTTPGGTTTSDFAVQTSVAGEVNLIDTALPSLTFWDGDAAGAAGNNAVDGGSGVWSATSTNWTTINGATNGAMHPQPGFAIFQGPAGAVSVDASAGDVAVTGMQFARDGYQINGAPVTLALASSVIRVGNGSAAGADFAATIGSVLTGTGGLNKTDLGALILTADNSYSGGTTINDGTLQLGNGGTSGSITGDVANGGALIFNRSDVTTFAGAISGAGTIEQNGAGTTNLIGNSSAFAGRVTINGGGLGVTSGGVLSADSVYAGADIGSTGALTVDGAGSSLVSADVLAVGAGGAGTLTVSHGATVSDSVAILGLLADSSGAATVDGAGSTWANINDLVIGSAGAGKLTIANGGSVTSGFGNLGAAVGALGTVTVDGAGSNWTNGGELVIGGHGFGVLMIENGGKVSSSFGGLAGNTGSAGTVAVNGAGSTWTNSGDLFVGVGGSGLLVIGNGGAVDNADGVVGYDLGATGLAAVDGAGSTWTSAGNLIVGMDGSGTLTIANSGAVSVGGTFVLASNAGSTGVLNIGASEGSTAMDAGMFDAGAFAFGAGAGTVNFNHTEASYVFSADMSGAGTINQLAGHTNLTGDSSGFIGSVNVDGGRLAVNGSLTGGQVTVGAEGMLGGNGVIGSLTAQSGAIVAPGNSIGTLNVAGNASFAAGSTYQVELTSTGQSDMLNVGGAVTIADGARLDIVKTDAVPYVLGTHYNILTAAGGVNGAYAFDNVQLTNFIGLVGGASAGSIYLDVAKTKTFVSAGVTANQVAIASGLDALPSANSLAGAIANLPTDAAAQDAFNQLSGEVHASAKGVMIENSRFVREAAIDRLRDTSEGEGSAVWGRAFGAWSQGDGDGNAASLKHDNSGVLIGADGLVGEAWRVGVIGGYSQSALHDNRRNASGASDNYDVGVFGGAQWGKIAFRSGLAYTWHDLSTNRSVAFANVSEALASHDKAGTAQAFGELGYSVTSGRVAFEPFANIAHVRLSTDGFTETGGAAALTGKGDDIGVTFATMGSRAASTFTLGNGWNVTARGTLGWRHAFGDTTPKAAMSFASGSSFDIGGAPIANDAAVAEAGVDMNISEKARLGFSYGGQFGSGSSDHSLRASFAVKF